MRFNLAVVLATVSVLVNAQSPAFDAASVKVNDRADARPGVDLTPGRFTAVAITLRELIKIAYPAGSSIRSDDQVSGGPDWIGRTRFDVTATGTPATPARPAAGAVSPQQSESLRAVQAMLQNLLRERFNLAVHHEPRELPI